MLRLQRQCEQQYMPLMCARQGQCQQYQQTRTRHFQCEQQHAIHAETSGTVAAVPMGVDRVSVSLNTCSLSQMWISQGQCQQSVCHKCGHELISAVTGHNFRHVRVGVSSSNINANQLFYCEQQHVTDTNTPGLVSAVACRRCGTIRVSAKSSMPQMLCQGQCQNVTCTSVKVGCVDTNQCLELSICVGWMFFQWSQAYFVWASVESTRTTYSCHAGGDESLSRSVEMAHLPNPCSESSGAV